MCTAARGVVRCSRWKRISLRCAASNTCQCNLHSGGSNYICNIKESMQRCNVTVHPGMKNAPGVPWMRGAMEAGRAKLSRSTGKYVWEPNAVSNLTHIHMLIHKTLRVDSPFEPAWSHPQNRPFTPAPDRRAAHKPAEVGSGHTARAALAAPPPQPWPPRSRGGMAWLPDTRWW